MPAFDGTGPNGNGPMTGLGAGLCRKNGNPLCQRGRGGCRRLGAAEPCVTLSQRIRLAEEHLKHLKERRGESEGE